MEERSASEIFSDAMKAKGLSVEKLAQITGISDRFLSLLLDDRFDKLPSAPYVHGYILKIAETLNLDGEELWRTYFKHTGIVKKSGAEDALPKNRFRSRVINKKVFLWGIFIFFVAAYVLTQLFSFFKNPGVFLEGIDDNTVVTTSSFHLIGKADPKDNIILNGEQLYPRDDGSFEKDLILAPGFNTLTFEVKKFLGKEYSFERQLFYEAPTSTEREPIIEEAGVEESGGGSSLEDSTETSDGL